MTRTTRIRTAAWAVLLLLLTIAVAGFASDNAVKKTSPRSATIQVTERSSATQRHVEGSSQVAETQGSIEPESGPELPQKSSSVDPSAGEQLDWLVIAHGGVTQSNSTNYGLGITVGQRATGNASSPSYQLGLGFWQGFGLTCCQNRGNVDGQFGPVGPVDVADLTYLVATLYTGGPEPPCPEEGNVDGIVGPAGPIDVADLTYLVAYLYTGGPDPPPCP